MVFQLHIPRERDTMPFQAAAAVSNVAILSGLQLEPLGNRCIIYISDRRKP